MGKPGKQVRRMVLGAIFCVFGQPAAYAQSEEVLKNWFFLRKDDQALYRHLTKEAFQHLEQRKQQVASINSLADWKKRQQLIQQHLQQAIGPFPARTPLRAQTVRILEKDSLRVEHIVFESQPGFVVTASLFMPKVLKSKAPAIVYCSGHSPTGYRSTPYLTAMLNLVQKGFIVFAFDPVGQGERLEYIDEKTGGSAVGQPTRQHDMPGVQAFITGSSQARYMIWDGIRAIDYLFTRPEVDTLRIGMTGRSGGGTQTAFISAIDQRILAAAPECYITNFTRLLESLGPPDAEQNLTAIIKRQIDEPDLLAVRAPKPTLIIATKNDYFSIEGTRETSNEVARIYNAYGKKGNFGMVEDEAPHASTVKNREAMYAFFQQHLKQPGKADENPVWQLTKEDLQVTTTGQVSSSLSSETVFSLNKKQADALVKKLDTLRLKPSTHAKAVRTAAKTLSDYRTPSNTDKAVFAGLFRKHDLLIEKYYIKGEGDYVIPYLLFVPEKKSGKVLLYLEPKGKALLLDSTPAIDFIQSMVLAGHYVVAPDLIGTGETGPGQWAGGNYFTHHKMEGVGYDLWYGAQLIGRSLVGIRAGDLVKLTRLLKQNSFNEIAAVTRREFSPILLHAAVFEPAIERIALLDPYISYHALTTQQYYNLDFLEGAVPQALKQYDLPDLAALLAPRRLLIVNPTDGKGQPLPLPAVEKEMQVVKQSYSGANASQLRLRNAEDTRKEITDFFSDWLNQNR